MIFYQKLQCDNYENINQQIIDYVQSLDFYSSTDSFWNPVDLVDLLKSTPLFYQWLTQSNLKIKSIAVTIGNHVDCCGVHVDTPPARYKLSWPVLNTLGSYNTWYQEIVDNCNTKINRWGGIQYLDINDLKPIKHVFVDSPMIIDAGIPHDVQFLSSNPVWPRIGLQGQFINEPVTL
jgi:hypothetical protein